MKNQKKFWILILPLVLAATGCLKTRSQIRGDEPMEANVQPVQNSYVLDEIKVELTRLNGKIEDLERERIDALKAGNQGSTPERVVELENRLAELEQTQIQILAALKRMEGDILTNNPENLFENGKKQFDGGNFDSAVRSFTLYLDNPKVKHQEDAVFYRGESHYANRDFKKAIIDFSKFPEKFQNSKLLPKALYKIGLSFEALGLKDDAVPFYQELVDRFGQTPEGRSAKQKILISRSRSEKKSAGTKLK